MRTSWHTGLEKDEHRSGSAVITAEGSPDCNTVKPEMLATIIFSV